MASPVLEFYNKTAEIVSLIEASAALERDEKINKITQMLNEREEILQALKPPFSPEEVDLGEKTKQLNDKLTALLAAEKINIQKDLRQLQHQRESSNKYANPYENLVGSDGVYLDKKN